MLTDTCQNPKGQPGICINIKSCTLLLNLLKSNAQDPQVGNFLRASVCGYENSDPFVCCPSSINGGTDNGSEGDQDQKEIINTAYGPLYPPNCGYSNVTLRRVVGGEPASLGIILASWKNMQLTRFSISNEIIISEFWRLFQEKFISIYRRKFKVCFFVF